MTNKKQPQSFFEASLQFVPDMEPVVSKENRIGKLMGSGTGEIKGERLKGTVTWTLFEVVGDVCQTNLAGIITTEDGADINFDSQGFGLVPDKAKPNDWHMVASLTFNTKDERYSWINSVLANWDGEFIMQTGTEDWFSNKHSYQAYISTEEERD